jgi:hypothetical protein
VEQGMNRDGREQLVQELSRLDYGNGVETSRLIGMIIALAGEVFVMKAQNERLRRALLAAGVVDPESIEQAGQGDSMKDWFAAEEQAFTQAILQPLMAGDQTINVVDRMRSI